MAGHIGLATMEFIARHTEDGAGVYLARSANGACTFLGAGGCSVHPARPLVCRLYPLGRTRFPDGSEAWEELEPHPLSQGRFGSDGTIAGYLEGQEAGALIRIADSYVDWVNRARAVLMRLGGKVEVDAHLFNLEDSVRAQCAQQGIPCPASLMERWRLHLEILDNELARLEERNDERE